MEPFQPFEAVAAPLPVPNIDTDQIIPARFLWRKRGDGWGHLLFHDLRFDDTGSPRPHFVLNRPDRKSTRLNSSHLGISYAVFCLKKKTIQNIELNSSDISLHNNK